MASEEVEQKLKEMNEREENEEGETSNRDGKRTDVKRRGKVTDTRSLYSSGSTFAPDEIKRRLMMVCASIIVIISLVIIC